MEKTVLVIGGAGGVGQTVSRAFYEKGNRVVLADVNFDRLASVAKAIGRDALHFRVDVRNEESVSKLINNVVHETGRIDSLFVVHGVTHGKIPVYERSLQEWEFVLRINLTGTFLCVKFAAPFMIRQKKGCIVALTTSRARPKDAPYYTSKMGIEGLVGTAALDLKDQGIGVFVVAPGGYLSTNFHDHSYELMRYDNFIPDNEKRKHQRAIKPEVVVPLFDYLHENVPLDLVGKKITAIDWNEQHGLGREAWYY